MKNTIERLEEMIMREKDKLERLYKRICETSPEEQDKLKRLNIQYDNLRNYIMGLDTALTYIKIEKGML